MQIKLVLNFALAIAATSISSFASSESMSDEKVPSMAPSQNVIGERIGGLDSVLLEQLILSNEVKPEEVVWLDVVYPGTEGVTKVLALEQKPRQPHTQGAILLLHDKEQHADWPFLIRSLRKGLPDAGWYTLSVNLPYDIVRTVPERSLAPKSAEEIVLNDTLKQALMKPASRSQAEGESNPILSATGEGVEEEPEMLAGEMREVGDQEVRGEPEIETPINDAAKEAVDIDLAAGGKSGTKTLSYRGRALIHIEAAMNHLRANGYQNIVVIAYREGANLALEHIKPTASEVPKQGFALVMIDPVLQYNYQSDIASAIGQNFKAPVLDIVNSTNLKSKEVAIERETGARMAEAAAYQQIKLSVNESISFQQFLQRRIRYWLEKYAPGMFATKVVDRR